MSAEEKQREIIAAWSAARPIDSDAAMSIADAVLNDHQKEKKQFGEWFRRNGAMALERVNAGF